jgi:hypothetical protein
VVLCCLFGGGGGAWEISKTARSVDGGWKVRNFDRRGKARRAIICGIIGRRSQQQMKTTFMMFGNGFRRLKSIL